MKTLLGILVGALFCGQPMQEPPLIGFARLAGFEYTEGMTLPDNIKKLDGKKIRISGFMQTEDRRQQGEAEYFIIISDACGCEGTPMMNEVVFCVMPEGEKATIKPGNVAVTGTFWVGEQKEDGIVVSLYGMEVEKVE